MLISFLGSEVCTEGLVSIEYHCVLLSKPKPFRKTTLQGEFNSSSRFMKLPNQRPFKVT